MERFGAKGEGTSVYFRDPDGSLMEFMSYRRCTEIDMAENVHRTIRLCCRTICRCRRTTARRAI